jgi:hypothetical protein
MMCSPLEQAINDLPGLVYGVQLPLSRDIFYPEKHTIAAEELRKHYKDIVVGRLDEV